MNFSTEPLNTERYTKISNLTNHKEADFTLLPLYSPRYLSLIHISMKPVLDETGRLIPREDYRLSTLNCGGEDFAVACMRANLRYEKNQRREDVKSHH